MPHFLFVRLSQNAALLQKKDTVLFVRPCCPQEEGMLVNRIQILGHYICCTLTLDSELQHRELYHRKIKIYSHWPIGE